MAALETLLVHLLSWLHKRIVLLHRLIRLLPASSSTFRQHSHPWAMATQCYNSVFPLVVVTAGDLCRPTPEPSSFTSFMAVLSMGFHESCDSPVLRRVRDSNSRSLSAFLFSSEVLSSTQPTLLFRLASTSTSS